MHAIEVSLSGFLALRFQAETRLEVVPDRKEDNGEDVEHWRFFSPGLDAAHLVYHSIGYQLE